MKTCSCCHQTKPKSNFRKRVLTKDGLDGKCKACHKDYDKGWYQKNRKRRSGQITAAANKARHRNRVKAANYLKQHPCVDCGEADIVILDFDHRDRSKKKMDIGNMLSSAYSWATIRKEIEKCDVRCANCHRRKTSKEFGWFRGLV